jgi:hypothetical protein
VVAEVLRGHGARDWQVGLTAAVLADALTATPAATETSEPSEASGV